LLLIACPYRFEGQIYQAAGGNGCSGRAALHR
jgi:hypothetical protein